jgi:hypothetical protein
VSDIDLPDENDITPLSLATQKNDMTSMQALLDASASANDGSLHDAARMANADAIKLLLTHGHDPNFPCVRFDGRPPLFELCLQWPRASEAEPSNDSAKGEDGEESYSGFDFGRGVHQ